jgi:transposase
VIPPEQNAAFVAAMEDVLDLYAEPYSAQFPVVCFDERPCFLIFDERPCFLIADVLTPIPLKLGQPMRYDYEYEKKGSANLFGFLEPGTGKRHLQVTARRTKRDFALIMKHLLTVLYPTATKVRLVLDNLNTHTVAALYDTFPAEEARSLARRLEFHFTPKHGSWLNAVELEFAALAKQCLDRRIGSIEELTTEVTAWCRERNVSGPTIDWRFDTPTARKKLKRVYPATEVTDQN